MLFTRDGDAKNHRQAAAFLVTWSENINQAKQKRRNLSLTWITDSSLLESEFSEALIASCSRWFI